jgi:hypothetical protein
VIGLKKKKYNYIYNMQKQNGGRIPQQKRINQNLEPTSMSQIITNVENKTAETLKLLIDKYVEIILNITLMITRKIRLTIEEYLKEIGVNKHVEWNKENQEIVELYNRILNLGDFLIKSDEIRKPLNSILFSVEELINPHVMNIIDQNIDLLDQSLQKLSNNLAKTLPDGLKKIIEGSMKGVKNGLFAAIPPPFDSGGLALLSIFSSMSTILNSCMLMLDTIATASDALSTSANQNIEKNVKTFAQTKKTIDKIQNQIDSLTNVVSNVTENKRKLLGQDPIPQNLTTSIPNTKQIASGGAKRKYKTPRKKRKKKRTTRKRKKRTKNKALKKKNRKKRT